MRRNTKSLRPTRALTTALAPFTAIEFEKKSVSTMSPSYHRRAPDAAVRWQVDGVEISRPAGTEFGI
jgi:hypothetical protein